MVEPRIFPRTGSERDFPVSVAHARNEVRIAICANCGTADSVFLSPDGGGGAAAERYLVRTISGVMA